VQTDDFRINATIRSILVRFWFNTSLLSHGSINGVVYIRGKLAKEVLKAGDSDLDKELPFLVRRLDKEIRNIRGVRDIVYNLENLKRVKGQWHTQTAGLEKTA
jgi:hypothetical protein